MGAPTTVLKMQSYHVFSSFVPCAGCCINLPSVLFVLVGHVLGPGLGDHLHVVGREHLQQPEDRCNKNIWLQKKNNKYKIVYMLTVKEIFLLQG